MMPSSPSLIRWIPGGLTGITGDNSRILNNSVVCLQMPGFQEVSPLGPAWEFRDLYSGPVHGFTRYLRGCGFEDPRGFRGMRNTIDLRSKSEVS